MGATEGEKRGVNRLALERTPHPCILPSLARDIDSTGVSDVAPRSGDDVTA